VDKATFASHDPGWWLTQKDGAPDAVSTSRTEIGGHLGLAAEWYTDPDALGKAFDKLEAGHSSLLSDADSLVTEGDEAARVAWLEKVAAALKPPANAPAPAGTAPGGAAAPHEPAPPKQDAPSPAADHAAETQAQAPAPTGGIAGGGAAADPAAAWDEGRQMLYRVRDGNYEFAHSDDKTTVRAGTQWMSQAEVDAEAHQAAGGSGDAWAERGIAVSYDAEAGHQYQFTNGDGAPIGEAMTAERATEALKEYEDLKAVFAGGGLDDDEMKEFAANPETSLAGVSEALGGDE